MILRYLIIVLWPHRCWNKNLLPANYKKQLIFVHCLKVPAISFKTTDKYKITTVRIGYEHGYKKVDEKENPDGTTTILEDIILELTPNGEERVTMLSNLTAGNKTLRSNEVKTKHPSCSLMGAKRYHCC